MLISDGKILKNVILQESKTHFVHILYPTNVNIIRLTDITCNTLNEKIKILQ